MAEGWLRTRSAYRLSPQALVRVPRAHRCRMSRLDKVSAAGRGSARGGRPTDLAGSSGVLRGVYPEVSKPGRSPARGTGREVFQRTTDRASGQAATGRDRPLTRRGNPAAGAGP